MTITTGAEHIMERYPEQSIISKTVQFFPTLSV